ncbi:MAG: GntG family PLP-dependent aldolase [Phycisphaerales bacterium]
MAPPIDLRSDTVTRPTPAMWDAMRDAQLGDDVLGDEPTVTALQDKLAKLLGKEAACFVPSGTMANQTAIRALTEPGDEIVCHPSAHIYHYETGAFAAISGCALRFAEGERGMFDVNALDAAIRPPNHHFAPARLVVVENTSNGGGGSVWPLDLVERVTSRAREHAMRTHLDGARLWNASVGAGVEPREYAEHFDTVSVCFSKGLGTPAGSAVAGDADTIARVFRFRKMFGGAMRQSGVLAAACIHALDHHIARLADDHANARRLGEGLAALDPISLDLAGVETNIVYFDLDPAWGDAPTLAARLESKGVRLLAVGAQRLRAVTHLDVTRAQIETAIEAAADAVGVPA